MDDAQILDLLRQGRPEGLRALSDRYRGRLVAYAGRVLGNRHEAEDVAQEVLLRAPKARELDRGSALAGWLYAVSYRLAVDKIRERGRSAKPSHWPRRALEVEAASSSAERNDEWKRVERLLHTLGEPYQTALVLRYIEGREFREIAESMGTIERTARTWVGRGLSRLRERLKPAP